MKRPHLFAAHLLLILVAAAFSLPGHAAPAWWASAGVIDTSKSRADYGPANAGQLKHLATCAYNAAKTLYADFDTAGAGLAFKENYLDVWEDAGVEHKDYKPVNIGQVKAVASLFYERLRDYGVDTPGGFLYASGLSSASAPARDYALANVGQLKNAFSFELAPSPGADTFVGPFSSWLNLKDDYGAVGDGVADDTDALQAALSDLQRSNLIYKAESVVTELNSSDEIESVEVAITTFNDIRGALGVDYFAENRSYGFRLADNSDHLSAIEISGTTLEIPALPAAAPANGSLHEVAAVSCTTLTADTTSTDLVVASVTGLSTGDYVRVTLDFGSFHVARIAGINTTTQTITVAPSIPGGTKASSGAQVFKLSVSDAIDGCTVAAAASASATAIHFTAPASAASAHWFRDEMTIMAVPLADSTYHYFLTSGRVFQTWVKLSALPAGTLNVNALVLPTVGSGASKRVQKAAVLYIPDGTYRITKTLVMEHEFHQESMGVAILGADPRTTVIAWDGPKDKAMMLINPWFSRIGRLTLNGAGRASPAAGKGRAEIGIFFQGGFSTQNWLHDLEIRDVFTGIQFGMSGNLGSRTAYVSRLVEPASRALSPTLYGEGGQAESIVERCRFTRCTGDQGAGIVMENYNSLDIWIRNCVFDSNSHGIWNKSGGFQASGNLFLRSSVWDIKAGGTIAFISNNQSIGSAQFAWLEGLFTVDGNRVLGCTATGSSSRMMTLSTGPFNLINNLFGPCASGSNTGKIEINSKVFTSLNNTYASESMVAFASGVTALVDKRVDDEVLSSTASLPPLEGFSPRVPTRKKPVSPTTTEVKPDEIIAFEVTADMPDSSVDRAAALQAAIDDAADLASASVAVVVHLPTGSLGVGSTIEIPSNKRIQILGDGGVGPASLILSSALKTLWFKGPSLASISHVCVVTTHSAPESAIQVDKADQEGGRVWIHGGQLSSEGSTSAAAVHVSGLAETQVGINSLVGGNKAGRFVDVTGKGGDASSTVRLEMAASMSHGGHYSVNDGGRLLARGVYFEPRTSQTVGVAKLSEASGEDSGECWLTIDSSNLKVGDTATDLPSFWTHNYTGHLGVTGNGIWRDYFLDPKRWWAPRYEHTGTGTPSVVIWGNTTRVNTSAPPSPATTFSDYLWQDAGNQVVGGMGAVLVNDGVTVAVAQNGDTITNAMLLDMASPFPSGVETDASPYAEGVTNFRCNGVSILGSNGSINQVLISDADFSAP